VNKFSFLERRVLLYNTGKNWLSGVKRVEIRKSFITSKRGRKKNSGAVIPLPIAVFDRPMEIAKR
jgi:hypothetical protein